MIVVDTSALFAVVLKEPHAPACEKILFQERRVLLSAGTLAEAMVVASRRNIRRELRELVETLAPEIIPVTAEISGRMGEAYARWGKGLHPAGLNFGDCFAYELATTYDCPLLFIGTDFARTDVKRALV